MLAALDGARRLVTAADHAAQTLGLAPGLPLAQAQARVPDLHIEAADPVADLAALERLGLWAVRRYCPLVAVDPPDGLLLDIAGAAHLMGSEQVLAEDLVQRSRASGLSARVAIADTIGAAHGLARFMGWPVTIVPPGGTRAAVAPLPIAALRLDAALVDRLRRLGFDTIAELEATPRAPLALRFGALVGRRLDQAHGRLAEPFEPLTDPILIDARRAFAEPIAAAETITRYIGKLVTALVERLEAAGLGARRLDLVIHRVDGGLQAIRVGTAAPARDVRRLTRLLVDKIETIDPGFGIELMSLTASLTEPLGAQQVGTLGEPPVTDIAGLVDALGNRFGPDKLYRAVAVQSDLPERAVRHVSALAPPSGETWPQRWPRPSRLFAKPEPVETLALLPDQPPVQFTWRGVRRRVKRADGPERVFGEWWRRDAERAAVRDYFMVEDEAGERFWLFRSGDGEDPATGDLTWYLHGIFG